jgi:5'-nucleotidase
MGELNFYNRRKFIKQTAKASVGFAALTFLPKFSLRAAKHEKVNITLLHTNDTHSHLDPFPENDPKYPGLGGIARRATLVNKIRAKEQHVLLLDAGDIFQGTPYFNLFGGKPEFELMSKMKYDAATLGNHDFDNGIDGLVKMLPYAQFPFINCNYDFSDTPLAGKVLPYKIFKKGNAKIGVIGVGVELNGLVAKKNYGNIHYLDPIYNADKQAEYLKMEEKCDMVVCLSHLGYRYKTAKVSDIHLAENTRYIDVIIGGHTHTFLDKPDIRKNKLGKKVLIAQVGWAGVKLGKINCEISLFRNTINYTSTTIKISKNQ